MRSRLLIIAFACLTLAACSTAVPSTPTKTAPVGPTGVAAATPTPLAVAQYSCGTRAVTWDGTSAIDLTGTWAGDDQGVYYLRQVGDQVWWLGMSGIGGPVAHRGTDWTNVYHGTLAGNTVTGTYADVPGGKIQDSGPVVLKLTLTSGGGISLNRTDPLLSTGFGGTLLTPCALG
jgi:hypothetical protein